MDKEKLYLDTSVLSYLEQTDVPEKMNDTLKFWEILKQDKYNIYVSTLTIIELNDCPEPKKSRILNLLSDISYTELKESEVARKLAIEYINAGILRNKSLDDCLHMAIATVNGIDTIVSWNFKHMVNHKTIKGVRKTNAENGYFKIIDIQQPTLLLEEE